MEEHHGDVHVKWRKIMNKITLISDKDLSGISIVACCNEKAIERNKELGHIKEVDLQGYIGHKFTYEISDTCKYYNPRLNMIRELIACLYSLEGCCCGGLCHIVTDDNNFRDEDLKCIINECDKEENKDRVEVPLCKLICEEMLKISIQERSLLFNSYYAEILCDKNCKICEVEKGKMID